MSNHGNILNMKKNISLKPYNTFNIDATARYFTTIDSIVSLQAILSDKQWKTIPLFILGGGSNILFTQNVDGLVIHNQIRGIELLEENNDHVYLKIGAGENWHQTVLYCINHNYAGIENLSLIPGTVGAAPIQNIGAYGVELKNVLYEVHTIDREKNIGCVFSNADCQFGYRDSIFKNSLRNTHIVTHVILRLNKKPIFNTTYSALCDKLTGCKLSIKAISNAVIQIRQAKLPDPAVIPNAGSFFKNPIISENIFSALQAQYPKMPYFPEGNVRYKIPAGWLIEQCGFRGKRCGNVGVHECHALVLVNYGGGTGLELKQFSEHMQAVVFQRFHIPLLAEVNIWGLDKENTPSGASCLT